MIIQSMAILILKNEKNSLIQERKRRGCNKPRPDSLKCWIELDNL